MWGTYVSNVINITSYDWDLRNIAEIDQGTADCELLQIFFQKLS